MKYIALIAVMACICAFSACKKKHNSFWFTGMEVTDSNGAKIKWVGDDDNDWQINKYTFTTQQTNLLNLNTSAFPNWGQTMVNIVAVAPGISPIGLDTSHYTYYTFIASADSDCVITYTVADEKMNSLASGNVFLAAGAVSYIPVQIPSSYLKTGSVYRVYYGFSAQLNRFFATGWGDFGVCTKNSGRINQCF